METQQRAVYTIQHVCIQARCCIKLGEPTQTKSTYLTSIQSDQRLFLCHVVVFPPTEKKQVSKPVSSIKQQLRIASEACGCQHEAVGQYLWLNRGRCAARRTPCSSLYSFRVPLQSADLLLCGSTRTDFDANHCPLIVSTCLIVLFLRF